MKPLRRAGFFTMVDAKEAEITSLSERWVRGEHAADLLREADERLQNGKRTT